MFYGIILDGTNPPPSFETWYDFGFSTCANEWKGYLLGGAYNSLLGRVKYWHDDDPDLGDILRPPERTHCSFNEFWHAFEAGTLPTVFDKYGLDTTSDLRAFLSSAYPPSIWRIKHMLALEPSTLLSQFPMVEEAAEEYGFTPGMSPRLRIELREFYMTLLGMCKPLDVHDAKEHGRLAKYADKHLEIQDEVKEVLREVDGRARPDE